MTEQAVERVDAHPEKRFFVDMLTRDIELAPAIIDLVDNSIDGAKRLRPQDSDDRYKDLWVKLHLGADAFEILDSCGGFDREHAATYAFKFGRHPDQPATAGEVGQFGVGMKRAIFKIGRKFKVACMNDDDRWQVEVDVDEWLEDPQDWTFPLESANGEAPEVPGTLVRCSRVLPSASSRLSQPAFVSRVLSEISMRHALALQQGLAIEVNDRSLVPRPPALLASDSLEPISYSENLTDSTGAEVEMQLYAGLSSGEEGDEEIDTDDPALFTGADAAGWYVFCNGRALLFANRGRLTGWGEEVPRFHPQFRRFRGFVYLTGDSAAMPWNTAKTTVDEDSEIWAQTRRHLVRRAPQVGYGDEPGQARGSADAARGSASGERHRALATFGPRAPERATCLQAARPCSASRIGRAQNRILDLCGHLRACERRTPNRSSLRDRTAHIRVLDAPGGRS